MVPVYIDRDTHFAERIILLRKTRHIDIKRKWPFKTREWQILVKNHRDKRRTFNWICDNGRTFRMRISKSDEKQKFPINGEKLSGWISFDIAEAVCSCERISFFSQIGEQMLTQFQLWIGRYSLFQNCWLEYAMSEKLGWLLRCLSPTGKAIDQPKFMLEIQFPDPKCFAWKLHFLSSSSAFVREIKWDNNWHSESTCWRSFDLSIFPSFDLSNRSFHDLYVK